MFAISRSHFAWITLAYAAVIGFVLYPGFHEGFGARLMLWNCVPPTIALIVTVTALGKSRRRFIFSAAFALLAAAVSTLFAGAWLFTSLDTDPHSSTTAIVFVFAPVWSLAIAMIGSGLVWFATRTTPRITGTGLLCISTLFVLFWGCSFLHASRPKQDEKSRLAIAPGTGPFGEIVRGPRGKSEIALTFDAGAEAECFDDLITALASAHVNSTFFITGIFTHEHPDCAAEITKHGHDVGNHTWSHLNLTQQSDDVVRDEITRAERAIVQVSGQNPKPRWRAPYGARDERVLKIATNLGYRSIYWTLDSLDGVEPAKTPQFLIDRITSKSDTELDGAIILMHVGVRSTADALPPIIANLQGRGFHLVTISTLLRGENSAH